jgi:manganese/zinc/iron transport system permease protein
MSSSQLDILLIALVTAAACALPGAFLVLRRTVMMSDAISHTVLLGIVIGFFLSGDLNSPWLILGAAAVGLVTVSLVSLLERTRLVKEDAAIGLVFPALFSIAVILITRYAGNVHLDVDAVLVGEIAYAPFNRLLVFGQDLGPRGLYVMGGIFLLNLFSILLFYKELKISTFDAGLAAVLGFSPWLVHYGLMALVSLTVVAAFDVVGSILVVALMVAPPASAYLLTNRLGAMLGLSVLIGGISACLGYAAAAALDTSIAGAMAAAAGGIFALVFLFSPEQGLLAAASRRKRQRLDFAQKMLAIHLLHHEGLPEADSESRIEHLQEHLGWRPHFASRVMHAAEKRAWIARQENRLVLTDLGRIQAQETLVR